MIDPRHGREVRLFWTPPQGVSAAVSGSAATVNPLVGLTGDKRTLCRPACTPAPSRTSGRPAGRRSAAAPDGRPPLPAARAVQPDRPTGSSNSRSSATGGTQLNIYDVLGVTV